MRPCPRAVRTAVDARLQSVVRNLPDQVRAVQQGLARGASLRDLLPVAPELMMALMPCWAMSPLLVPSHVPAGVWFDVVVVDEASQVGTAEVVPDEFRDGAYILHVNGVPSSHIVLGEPQELDFEYMRWIAAAVEQLNTVSPNKLRVTHLGGAG